MISKILAQLLEPSEREVVLGDLTERGAGTIETVRELSGLIARRQAAMWGHWRPWTALLLLTLPFSLALSTQSRFTAGGSSITLWLYINNWDWNLIDLPSFQYQFLQYLAEVLLSYLTLACYSWIGGFAIGGVARRSIPALAMFLGISLFLGEFAALPWVQGQIPHAFADRNWSPNAAVFNVWFYREMLPPLVQFSLVFIPALSGMRQGAKIASFGPLAKAILWTATTAAMSSLLISSSVWWALFTNRSFALSIAGNPWVHLLQPMVYWPIVYWIGRIAYQRLAVTSSGNMLP